MPHLRRVSKAVALLLTFAALAAWAQPAAPGRGGVAVRSPEVSADSKVTFRLRAPNAKEVFVTGIGPDGRRYRLNEPEFNMGGGPLESSFTGTIWQWLTAST